MMLDRRERTPPRLGADGKVKSYAVMGGGTIERS